MMKRLIFRAPLSFAATAGARTPNALMVTLDNAGWKDVGYNGGRIVAPAIDR